MYATSLAAIHLIKTQVSTPWRCLRITKVSRVHPLGAMSVCMQCQYIETLFRYSSEDKSGGPTD